jgi:hypothetical protein
MASPGGTGRDRAPTRDAASTVHAVLVRCRLNRLSCIGRRTDEPIRLYEHESFGALIYFDVKKLGKHPDGGGWRYVGCQQGDGHKAELGWCRGP